MARKKKVALADKPDDHIDLIFTFKYCCMDVVCDEDMYDKEQIKEIKRIVAHLSKEIMIDKSYVSYEGTKFEKTFIREEGWNELCKLVYKTRWGNRCTKTQNLVILEAYKAFIEYYLYQCLTDLGWDCDGINIDMAPDTKFMSEVEVDEIKAWEKYPGKWQTWDWL